MGLLANRNKANGAVAPAVAAAVAAPATNTPWIPTAPGVSVGPVFQQAPQPVPPQPQPVAAAPAPAVPVAFTAAQATQGQRYVVNGLATLYLCATGANTHSFLPIAANGSANGTPMQVEASTPIIPIPAEGAPAAVATGVPAPAATLPVPPPPARKGLPPIMDVPPPPMAAAPAQPTVTREAPPPAPLAAQVAPLPPAPGIGAPATAQAAPAPIAEAPKRRGRRTNAEIAAANAATGAAPASAAVAPAATPRSGVGITLFVNAVPTGEWTDLSEYVEEVTSDMRQQFNVADIRVAPDDSPLAFGKFEGVLAGLVRATPPAAGTYVAFTKESKLAAIVVEALAPLCAKGQFVRGV